MMTVRFSGEPNQQLFLGIEQPQPGLWFDWKTGTWLVKPMVEIQPFVQDSYMPGRYTIDYANQQGIFVNALELIFWVVSNTGLATPTRQVVQGYTTQMVSNPPWALHQYGFYVFISNPAVAVKV